MNLKDRVIHEIYLDLQIPKIIIEEVVGSQFEFIKHVAMPTLKNTRLMYFGSFVIKPNRLKYYKNNKKDESK